MRVMITGSSGMLGKALIGGLSPEWEIAGVDVTPPPPVEGRRFAFYRADVTDAGGIASCVERIAPDLIINAAAYTDVDGCELDPEKAERVNAGGTGNVAAAAGKAGALLLHLSTDFVFDGGSERPYRETDEPRPLSVYGRTKLKSEELVRAFCPYHVIVRTSWLFGPGGKNFVDTIIARAEAGEPLRVVNDQVGCPTYTIDLTQAFNRLLGKIMVPGPEKGMPVKKQYWERKKDFFGIFHAANQGKCSWYELAVRTLEYRGIGVPVQAITTAELGRPALRPKMSALDCDRLKHRTGHSLRTWPEALREYLRTKNADR